MASAAAFSRSSSSSTLNPNADPFLFHTPPPRPIFRQLPPWSSRVAAWTPPSSVVHHGYGLFGFYDVVPPPLPHNYYFVGEIMKNRNKLKKIRKGSSPNSQLPNHNPYHQFPSPHLDFIPFQTTTLMIKNIPNQFRRRHLLNILDQHCKWNNANSNNKKKNRFQSCRRSEYDFLYLPMDFGKYWEDGKISNLGYAFVNFTSPGAASEFCKAFHRRQWEVVVNNKVCEIKAAKFQGLKALTDTFKNKIFWCHANNYLPVVLEPPSDGFRRYQATPVGKRISRPPPNPIKKCG